MTPDRLSAVDEAELEPPVGTGLTFSHLTTESSSDTEVESTARLCQKRHVFNVKNKQTNKKKNVCSFCDRGTTSKDENKQKCCCHPQFEVGMVLF